MLQCWSRNALGTVHVSESMLQNLSVAVADGRIYAAEEIDNAEGAGCIVFADSGEVCFRTAGRNPVLRNTAWGPMLLCERVGAGGSGIDLRLHALDGGQAGRTWTLKSDDLNIHADMAYDSGSDSLLVCWESTPVWGFDPYVGRHRDINMRRLAGDRVLGPAPGTTNGRLALPRVAHLNRCDTNMPPVYPRVLAIDGNPAAAYRNYRFRAGRAFGWHVFFTRYDGRTWTDPLRGSEHPGPPDAGYVILQRDGELLGFFPCCDNDPPASPTRNHRIEVHRIEVDDGTRPEAVPLRGRGFYQIPFGVPHAAPDPPALQQADDGWTLVWGDLHQHTAQSKCLACIDGSLEDVLSFQRDILGCRVLTVAEHFHFMGAQEFTWHLDALEAAAAGRCMVLYGSEPGVNPPGHDTNLYAIDREIFERLRLIVLSALGRSTIYEGIKRHLPEGSVIAIRHFHGWAQEIASSETLKTWDPELGWQMPRKM